MKHHDNPQRTMHAPPPTRQGAYPCTHRPRQQGQLSITIIIAILVVAILGGLFYQATLLVKERSKKTIESQTMTQSKVTPVRDYIQACLDLSSKDAFITLGQQAGYLFAGGKGTILEGQGGLTTDFQPSDSGVRFILDPDNPKKIIPYAVFARESTTIQNKLFSDPPKSPYDTFPMYRLENDIGKSPDPIPYDGLYHLDGIFGANLLPNLDGIQPLPDFLDPRHTQPPIPSIVDQLERFILNHSLSCIDFSSFTRANMDFTPGKANVSVIFLNGTTIHLTYPLRMTDRITRGQAVLTDWITILPLRFAYLYAVLDFAASRESDKLLFIMSNLTTPDGSITPTLRKNVKAGQDYIVTYTDSQSVIDGKSYQFRFALHNRPPALYYINRTIKGPDYNRPGPVTDLKLDDVTSFTICASKTKDGNPLPATITVTNRGQGDILEIINARVSSASNQCPQTNLRLPLFAIDPDEDTLTFSISILGEDTKSYRVEPEHAELLEAQNKKLSITVKTSDGKLIDTQELQFPTHFEPPRKS